MSKNDAPETCASLVMITGAAGGLGKAFAVECASRGWNLFLTDLSDAALETLAGSLHNTYGVRVLYRSCDLTDAASRSALFQHLHAQAFHFRTLINVAGTDFEGLFLEQSRQQIQTILRLNIEGTLDMIHALIERRDPLAQFHIINVASLAAFYPMPVKATYAASKRFLLDFSLALREEMSDLGVTVTALCPAGLPTTAECIRAIEAQGWMGYATTCDVGAVAAATIDAALKGRPLVIPGWINRLLYVLGSMTPVSLVVRLIGSRWKNARSQPELREDLQPVTV